MKGLEEVLDSTTELNIRPPVKSEIALLNELIDRELLQSPRKESKGGEEEEKEETQLNLTTTTPQKSIVNDVEGYIRLTEDEINEIINEPSKFDQTLNLDPSEPVLENSITCTSF